MTFFKTFTNLRYFLPVYPLMILLFYYGLSKILVNELLRKIVLVAVLVLFFISNFATLDPLSKKIYGTFRFGNHEILKMTSVTKECCGYGRDQIIYNLQYLNIPFLLDEIFSDIKPDRGTVFAYQLLVGPAIFPKIDEETHFRTLRNYRAFDANIINWIYDDLREKPEEFYYIEFPNVEKEADFKKYLQDYRVVSEKIYEKRGYKMKVYSMEKI